MFIFSWQGLGFLVPATMCLPFLIVFGISELFNISIESNLSAILYGIAGIAAPISNYWLGRALNRGQIKHMFCEIRYEHWAVILTALEVIVALAVASFVVQDHHAGGAIEGILFWAFMISVLVVPVSTAIYIRKHKRSVT
jgi:hypothetical protein